jgi:ElaB/YqjD/DUF883 family membrane-anchored ribosome-binding protein
MSILSGMADMITQLKTAVDDEKDNLERDVTSAISKIVSETGRAFDSVFDDIKEALRDAGEFVESDFKALETLLEKVVRKMGSFAENEYHSFESKVEGVIHNIENIAKRATEEVAHATEYVRHKAYDDFEEAVNGARTEFDKAKNGFENAVESMGRSLVDKVKTGVKTVVSSAQHDLDKINNLRKDIDSELRDKVRAVEAELRKLKDDATKELDKISAYMHKELEKLESRVLSLKNSVNSMATVVGATALVAAIAIAISMFAYSKRAKSDANTDGYNY